MEQVLQKRVIFVTDDPNLTAAARTAFIVKWAIVAGIFAFFLLWFVGGYFHARRRIKKGLPPLRYHRFLVPEHLRPPRKPRGAHNQYAFYRMEEGYNMDRMPPPVYDGSQGAPPTYQPPDGASKVAPFQGNATGEPGLPPSQLGVEAPLQSRPATARSPRSPWLSKIIPRRNK